MYSDWCIQEKGRASATGRWRKESHLVLGTRHSSRKKEKIEREGEGAPQGRATVKGREGKEVIGCEVIRLDLGFRKVWREKGDMLTQDQYILV